MLDNASPNSLTRNSKGAAPLKPRFDAAKLSVQGWRLYSVRPAESRGSGEIDLFSLWVPEGTERYTREVAVAAIKVHEVASPSDAQRLATQLANQCQIAATLRRAPMGEVAYTGAEGIPVVFARGPFAAIVVQAERATIPALDIAQALDAHLAELAKEPSDRNAE